MNYAVETFGQIDVWINNAGLSAGMRFFDELSAAEIKEIVDVNITGTMLASRIIIPYFIKQGKGILINMGGMGSKPIGSRKWIKVTQSMQQGNPSSLV